MFGKYYLVDPIATGGMAEIFKAKTFAHGGFESLFVIKRILPHLGEDEEFVEMFVDEAKVSVVLQHPNIVRVFDFGKHGPNFFIAMEHVAGHDLYRTMRASLRIRQPMPPRFAAHIAGEACRGLHYAHTRRDERGTPLGIVHRDMSPSNILLSYDGDVKVADFGIAKAEDKIASTDIGVLKGKYEYMSPEQAEGQDIDARSDMFSLGVVLYEMLSGRRAFRSESDEETLRRIREVDIEPLASIAPTVPNALVDVVERAMQRDPADRYASTSEMGEALRRAIDPLTHEELREELGAWMRGLFASQMAAERERLDVGTHMARLLWSAGQGQQGQLVDAPAAQPTQQGRLVGTLVVALIAMLLVLAALSWSSMQVQEIPQVQVAATGSITFELEEDARIFIGGREAGHGSVLTVDGLSPGEHRMRIEVPGKRPIDELVSVTRGGTTVVKRELQGWGDAAPKIRFVSQPPGASVILDGEELGKTPLEWNSGAPGTRYEVEMTKTGHRSFATVIEPMEEGAEQEVRGKLVSLSASANTTRGNDRGSSESAGSGKLRVVLMGATWAHVWVDGKKLTQTAPLAGVELAAGSHTIRVENSAQGLDETQKIVVKSGEQKTVRVLAR